MAIELKKHRETEALLGLNVCFMGFKTSTVGHILRRTEAQLGVAMERYEPEADFVVLAENNAQGYFPHERFNEAQKDKKPMIMENEYREILKGSKAGKQALFRLRFKCNKPFSKPASTAHQIQKFIRSAKPLNKPELALYMI